MIKVTCAIIRNEDEDVLIVQRGEKSDHPFKWEFPGGKLNEGENEEECIIREISEELSIDIVILTRMKSVDYNYGSKHILLTPFICDTLEELPVLSEHIDFRWIPPSELNGIDFSEADVIVAEDYMKDIKSSRKEAENPKIGADNIAEYEDLMLMISSIMGRKEAEWVAKSAVENPVIFQKLIEYSYSDDRKLAFHSSWILSKVCDQAPDIIYPYLKAMVLGLGKLENESSQRSFLRIISISELKNLGEKYQGILAEYCFTALKSGFSPIAVKAYSMEILYKLAIIYPGLVQELAACINILQGEGSAGIISRGRMILKKLSEITSED
jgi:8-oxo-dGTP diphosphatase